MGMFTTRQPRKFRRVSIYTDERRDKLEKLVNDVKREKGELPPEPYDPTKFKGTFSEYTPRAKRHSQKGTRLSWLIAIVIVILLLIVWHYLLTGTFRF